MLLFSSCVYLQAQYCGGGEFAIKIYSLNGTEVKNLQYEIFVANQERVDELLKVNPNYADTAPNLYWGEELPLEYVPECIAQQKFEEDESLEQLRNWAGEVPPSKGKIKNGVLLFLTNETYPEEHILRIFTDEQELYIYANLLGGCDRETYILWDDYPRIAR